MADYVTILVVAFLAQLAVLPGEKVQFIIAGLSTRYHPLGVVAMAGAAFAGWTAVEIAFGQAVQRALSPVVLDGITAGLFLLFAVLLARSAPDPGQDVGATTDGGIAVVENMEIPLLGRELPDRFGAYVPIFLLMAAGEFGDKTQIITITLAIKYGATSAIWFGEMLAIIPVSLLNAYFFHRFSHLFEMRKVHFGAAALFAFFGLDTVLSMTVGVSVWEMLVTTVSTAVLGAV
ncbi:MAG: TMEM165/GDT1 family protein [Halobacteriales archaeon]